MVLFAHEAMLAAPPSNPPPTITITAPTLSESFSTLSLHTEIARQFHPPLAKPTPSTRPTPLSNFLTADRVIVQKGFAVNSFLNPFSGLPVYPDPQPANKHEPAGLWHAINRKPTALEQALFRGGSAMADKEIEMSQPGWFELREKQMRRQRERQKRWRPTAIRIVEPGEEECAIASDAEDGDEGGEKRGCRRDAKPRARMIARDARPRRKITGPLKRPPALDEDDGKECVEDDFQGVFGNMEMDESDDSGYQTQSTLGISGPKAKGTSRGG